MSAVWLSVLLSTLAFWGNAIRLRSPFSYETRPPTELWADHPIKLVPTPPQTGKDDLLTTAATHMALLHNSLIRGYNSIVLQAPHVQDGDKEDFVQYSRTWVRFLKSHHDDEENLLFPEIQGMLTDQQIMADGYKEHESFIDALTELDTYLGSLSNATNLASSTLLKIMESFRTPLEYHLHHEVSMMAALATHPKVPPRHSFQGAVAAERLKAWGKETVRKAGLWDVVPFFLLNADRTAEGGLWKSWPPMPAPIRWGMVNLVGAVHGGWWRFASCDAAGRPRELYALMARTDEGEAKTEL